jgi:hypothetical protein
MNEIQDCSEFDKLCEPLDVLLAAHRNEPPTVEGFMEEMSHVWRIQDHAAFGHNGEPCHSEFARHMTAA